MDCLKLQVKQSKKFSPSVYPFSVPLATVHYESVGYAAIMRSGMESHTISELVG